MAYKYHLTIGDGGIGLVRDMFGLCTR